MTELDHMRRFRELEEKAKIVGLVVLPSPNEFCVYHQEPVIDKTCSCTRLRTLSELAAFIEGYSQILTESDRIKQRILQNKLSKEQLEKGI